MGDRATGGGSVWMETWDEKGDDRKMGGDGNRSGNWTDIGCRWKRSNFYHASFQRSL